MRLGHLREALRQSRPMVLQQVVSPVLPILGHRGGVAAVDLRV